MRINKEYSGDFVRVIKGMLMIVGTHTALGNAYYIVTTVQPTPECLYHTFISKKKEKKKNNMHSVCYSTVKRLIEIYCSNFL